LTQLHLVAVFVRLFAAYILVSTLQAIPSYWSGVALLETDTSGKLVGFSILAAPLIAALLMWAFHLSVAKQFFVTNAGSQDVQIGSFDLEAALFSVVGLWFVSAGVIDLVYFLSLIHITTAPNWSLQLFNPEQSANFIATWAELLVGVFLLFRGRSFSGFVAKIRG
jgi:hypothetical protein